MKKARFVALILVLALAVVSAGVLVGGCKKQEADVLKIGVEGAFPPFNYYNEGNQLVGFEIDLAEALCEKLGMTPEFVPTEWSGIMTGLLSKKYDCIIASMTITPARLEQVKFSTTYYTDGDNLVVRANETRINTPADMAGKVVGATTGTSQETAANELHAQYGLAEIKLYPSDVEGIADLVNGRIDAFIAAKLQILFRITSTGEQIKLVGDPLNNMEKGVAIRKEDTQLLQRVNAALQEMFADGTYAAISQTWFGRNIMDD
jgi:ABC-type amino acid transport substrate-binding protein